MAPDDWAPVMEEELDDDDVMDAVGRRSRAGWDAEKSREAEAA